MSLLAQIEAEINLKHYASSAVARYLCRRLNAEC
jgi:hypothetical protein